MSNNYTLGSGQCIRSACNDLFVSHSFSSPYRHLSQAEVDPELENAANTEKTAASGKYD